MIGVVIVTIILLEAIAYAALYRTNYNNSIVVNEIQSLTIKDYGSSKYQTR